MDWLKKVLSSLWLLPIRLKSNIIINKVLFLKTTISVSKTSEIVISDATIIRNSMKIRGNNSYVSAVNSSITNSQIVIDGDNCHLILQEGTMINNSKIVIRGVNCAIEIGGRYYHRERRFCLYGDWQQYKYWCKMHDCR